MYCSHEAFDGNFFEFLRFRQHVAEACGGSYPPHSPRFKCKSGSKPDENRFYYDKEKVPPSMHAACHLFLGSNDTDVAFTMAQTRSLGPFMRWVASEARFTSTKTTCLAFAAGVELALKNDEPLSYVRPAFPDNLEYWPPEEGEDHGEVVVPVGGWLFVLSVGEGVYPGVLHGDGRFGVGRAEGRLDLTGEVPQRGSVTGASAVMERAIWRVLGVS